MCTICFSVFVVRKFVTDINSYSVATRVPSQRPAKRVTHWPLNGFDEKQFVGLVRFCGVPQRSSKQVLCRPRNKCTDLGGCWLQPQRLSPAFLFCGTPWCNPNAWSEGVPESLQAWRWNPEVRWPPQESRSNWSSPVGSPDSDPLCFTRCTWLRMFISC